MPANNTPPKPGAGSTGSSRCPRATRRVGATGREWKISISASTATSVSVSILFCVAQSRRVLR